MREDTVPRFTARPRREEPAQSAREAPLLRVAAWLGLTVVTLVAAAVLLITYRELSTPDPALSAPPVRDGPEIDADVLSRMIDDGVAVALADAASASPQVITGEIVFTTPTPPPTPPPPKTTPKPGRMLCPDNPFTLPEGELCKGAPAPLPPPTPHPVCQTPAVPGLVCEVRHAERGVMATPVATKAIASAIASPPPDVPTPYLPGGNR